MLLIDGFNLFRRVYGANPAPDSVEKAEGAIKASHSSILRALREHSPSHCALILDPFGKNWRHDLHPGYKSGRPSRFSDLSKEIANYAVHNDRAVESVIQMDGFEADDIIGSLAIEARQQFLEVVVLSTDRDMLCLLPFGVKLYHHFDNYWMDEQWCWDKFGVTPECYLDLVALVGNSTDGIPGVDRVGAKTASKLLNEHGSLENILENVDSIPGAVGINIKAQQDRARLSKELVQLKMDAARGLFVIEDLKVS